jgi:cytochrome d ubiquinol oxidase subunit I
MTAFLIFVFRMIRRGPEAAPDHAEASASLKNALRLLESPTANAVLVR